MGVKAGRQENLVANVAFNFVSRVLVADPMLLLDVPRD